MSSGETTPDCGLAEGMARGLGPASSALSAPVCSDTVLVYAQPCPCCWHSPELNGPHVKLNIAGTGGYEEKDRG